MKENQKNGNWEKNVPTLANKKIQKEPIKGWKKWLTMLVALLSGIYIFFPEFTDAFPIIGWLDEGIALLLLTYSLDKLGLRIPILDSILKRKTEKNEKK
ncbi:MAG: hypothetical protein ACK4UJ_02875 [Leptonema sp. (in: bacteria)]